MAVCLSCGYDGSREGEDCPLCGTRPHPRPAPSEERTVAIGEAPTVSPATPPQAPGTPLPEGETFAGRWVVEALLGRGGMGTVYRVRDGRDGGRKALKILHASVMEGPDGLVRFRREVELLSRVRHPAVPAVEAWGTDGGRAYTVTTLVEGTDLKEEVRRRGCIPPQEAARIAGDVADALHAAHLSGVIHRDVKPQNVMLDAERRVHLLDFGIARSVARGTMALTGTGVTLGTPEYMSPEQFDTPRVDARSDVYSLGVLMYEMLTGALPFKGDSPVSVAISHRTEKPVDVRSLRPDVPVWLSRIVATCLEKERSRRFGSAEELAAALRKSHPARSTRTRRLRSGDVVREEEPEVSGFAVQLETTGERPGWEEGMALLFEGRHYALSEVLPPPRTVDPWTYRFVPWPEQEVLRRVVDYEADSREREERTRGSFLSRLKRLLPDGSGGGTR